MVSFIPGGSEVISEPKGTKKIIGEGVATNITSYTEIVAYIITKGKTFHLAKIKVPCENEHWLLLTVGDTVYPPDLVLAGSTFIDWFPWDDGVLGDGSQKISIEALATATGETLYGTIWGQEE